MQTDTDQPLRVSYLGGTHLLLSAAWSHALWAQGYADGYTAGRQRGRLALVILSALAGAACAVSWRLWHVASGLI